MSKQSFLESLQRQIIPIISIAWCLIVIIDQLLGNLFGLSFIYEEWASMTIITSSLFIVLFSTRMIETSGIRLTLFKILGVFALIDLMLGFIYGDRTYISSLATSGLFFILSINGIYTERNEKIYLRFSFKFLVYVTSNIVLIFYFLDPSNLYALPGFESVSWNTATGFLLYVSTLLSEYYDHLISNTELPDDFSLINKKLVDGWFTVSFLTPVLIIFTISVLYFFGILTTKTGMALGLLFVCLIPFPLTYVIYQQTMDWSINIFRKNKRLFHREEDLKFHNELFEEFAQITSHNLRGPIVGLKNLSEMILDEDTSEEQLRKNYKLFDEKITSLAQTVDDLAEFYNMIKMGQVKYQKCNIRQHFEQAISICMNNFDSNINEDEVDIQYDLEIATIEYPIVYFENMAYNLVSNSFRYRDENCPLVMKLTSRIIDKDCTELTFRDNGIGMNLEYFGNKIFKFGESYHNYSESSGIGLFMVKNQLARLGDSIAVKSEEGEFTEFIMKLNQNGKKELGYS